MTTSVAADRDVAALVLDGAGLVVAEDGEDVTVRFAREVPPEPRASVLWAARGPDGEAECRVVAPSGQAVWRRAPWPAADALFELDAPGHGLLVVGDGPAHDIAQMLRERATEVSATAELDRGLLEGASVVVMAQTAGRPLPAEAPAVLAAGRLLVTTPRSPAFGLRPGIDHLGGGSEEEIVDLATSAAMHWDAFRAMRVYGRVAAERHRASRVVADLMRDLELDL